MRVGRRFEGREGSGEAGFRRPAAIGFGERGVEAAQAAARADAAGADA